MVARGGVQEEEEDWDRVVVANWSQGTLLGDSTPTSPPACTPRAQISVVLSRIC
jgi:hypothetical protein